jgi:hypothetical protein
MLKDSEIKKFTILQMLQHTQKCFRKFDEDLTMRQYEQQYQRVMIHAKRQYNFALNSFVKRLGTFRNPALEFRKRIFNLHRNLDLRWLEEMTVPTVVPIANQIVLREIRALEAEVAVFLEMELADRVIGIPHLIETGWEIGAVVGESKFLCAIVCDVMAGPGDGSSLRYWRISVSWSLCCQ